MPVAAPPYSVLSAHVVLNLTSMLSCGREHMQHEAGPWEQPLTPPHGPADPRALRTVLPTLNRILPKDPFACGVQEVRHATHWVSFSYFSPAVYVCWLHEMNGYVGNAVAPELVKV